MRRSAKPDEAATIIAEDVTYMRRYAKAGYNVLMDPSHPWAERMGEKPIGLCWNWARNRLSSQRQSGRPCGRDAAAEIFFTMNGSNPRDL
jgi:hypothetical protein